MRTTMQRWFLIALLTLVSPSALALAVRNPSEAGLLCSGVFWNSDSCCFPLSFRVGYEADFVFDRHLQDQSSPHSTVDETQQTTNAGYWAVNAFNRFDIFGTLGASYMLIKSTVAPFEPAIGFVHGNTLQIQTASDFSWSIGIRGVVFEWCGLSLGAEGEYFNTRPKIDWIVIDSDDDDYPSDLHMKYQEWQISVGVTYSIVDIVFPYIAGKWSGLRADFGDFISNGATLNTLRNTRNFGYAVGFAFNVASLLFTLEWSFQDERALFLNGQFRF
jgi:major outer membrane protein